MSGAPKYILYSGGFLRIFSDIVLGRNLGNVITKNISWYFQQYSPGSSVIYLPDYNHNYVLLTNPLCWQLLPLALAKYLAGDMSSEYTGMNWIELVCKGTSRDAGKQTGRQIWITLTIITMLSMYKCVSNLICNAST